MLRKAIEQRSEAKRCDATRIGVHGDEARYSRAYKASKRSITGQTHCRQGITSVLLPKPSQRSIVTNNSTTMYSGRWPMSQHKRRNRATPTTPRKSSPNCQTIRMKNWNTSLLVKVIAPPGWGSPTSMGHGAPDGSSVRRATGRRTSTWATSSSCLASLQMRHHPKHPHSTSAIPRGPDGHSGGFCLGGGQLDPVCRSAPSVPRCIQRGLAELARSEPLH